MIKSIITACLALISFWLHGQPANGVQSMSELIKDNYTFAEKQYEYMMALIPADKMPQSYYEKNNKLDAKDIKWWCSGFYPGALWYIYEQTKNLKIKNEAERALKVIEPNQYFTGNHDLGFMMFCSFGNAYRITNEKKYKDIIFNAAQSLSTRYKPSIKAIQSWDSSKNFKCPVIIDNMMNLELLYWVSDNGGDKKYRNIAIQHANTTIKNHFRADNSSWHVLDYNLATGGIWKKKTWQGAADCSAWSRGQAWGLYGYVLMYRFSKNKTYLHQAEKIAKFMLQHPNLPADKIPYWDYDAPHIQHRDVSAAAITASALLELGRYTAGAAKSNYIHHSEIILRSLSSDAYKAKLNENGGFILKHSTGAFPFNSEVDVPLIYADYYFLEALKRYKDWYL